MRETGAMMSSTAADLAAVAGLLADRTRAAMLLALMDGRPWTAGELARVSGVAAATATAHLDRLVAGGLLTEVRRGRHRFVRLADSDAAELVERLAERTPFLPPGGGLTAVSRQRQETAARTCYDHLAGRLGVGVTEAMVARGYLRQTLELTPRGEVWLSDSGVKLAGGKRPLTRACLDWTERRPHVAGRVGAAFCSHALDHGWVIRFGTGRAVKLTAAGRLALWNELGMADTTTR